MSLEQLMAYAARLSSQAAVPLALQPRPLPVRPCRVSLSEQEWAQLFPDSQTPATLPRVPPQARHA